MLTQTHWLFCTAFSKAGALRVAEPRGLSALAVSFCELFLCGFCHKEKVDKRQATAKVEGAIYRYQNSYNAFFFDSIATKKKALQKRNGGFACAAGATARGAPPLKRWTKQQVGLCETMPTAYAVGILIDHSLSTDSESLSGVSSKVSPWGAFIILSRSSFSR